MKHLFYKYIYGAAVALAAIQPVTADVTEKAVSNLRHQVLDYPQEKLYIQLDKPGYTAGDTIWFRGHTASEAFHLPSALSRGIFIKLIGPDGTMLERFSLLPIDKRLYSSFLALPDYLPEGIYTFQAYSERMLGKRSHAYFSRPIHVTNPVRSYEPTQQSTQNGFGIRFHPEGGNLLEGQTIEVAFTAKTSEGKPSEVKGEVYASTGERVAILKTLEPGIGRFSLPVASGTAYYAIIQNEENNTLHVDLPPVQTRGYSLKVADLIDSWYVSVLEAGSEKITDNLHLLLLLRGVPQYTFELTPEKDFMNISKDVLESGVHQLVLMNDQHKVLSERLLFANNNDQANVDWQLKTDSGRSESLTNNSISLELTVTDAEGKPLSSEFSVSAYPEDSLLTHPPLSIAADFLLSSDLNLTLDNPDRFLNKQDAVSQVLLDTWLIASRWPKFDIQRAIDGLLESSWDIGEQEDESVQKERSGIYSPLTAEELAERNEILLTINLKEVNVTAEQLGKHIKPYTYTNHTISGKDLVEQGASIQDYLSTLPGVYWDYSTETMSIRGGSVTFLQDGSLVDARILITIPAADIESIDVLKDPGNMSLLKFSSGDTSMTAGGGVVAIWTKQAYDRKPKAPKNIRPAGKKIDDDVRRIMMPGTKDTWLSQFPNTTRNNLWKPCVLTDDLGKATIRLLLPQGSGNMVLEMNGLSFNGRLISRTITLDLTALP